MANELSPEERLLRLIKQKQKDADAKDKKSDRQASEADDIEKDSQPFIRLDEEQPDIEKPIKADIENRKKETKAPEKKPAPEKRVVEKTVSKAKTLPAKRQHTGFKTVYLYIAAGLIALLAAGFLIYDGYAGRQDKELEDLQRLIASISTESIKVQDEKEQKKPDDEQPPGKDKTAASKPGGFEEYQDILASKKIFAPPSASSRKAAVKEGPGLRELVKDIRLVGVLPGDNPQAIIEDKKSGQTFFLQKGDNIEDILIKDISAGKVVLEYQQETITLSL
jgi:hypothetical protein